MVTLYNDTTNRGKGGRRARAPSSHILRLALHCSARRSAPRGEQRELESWALFRPERSHPHWKLRRPPKGVRLLEIFPETTLLKTAVLTAFELFP